MGMEKSDMDRRQKMITKTNTLEQSNSRIEVADVLRGFAVLGILLVHSAEHFNLMVYPEVTNEWLKFFDEIAHSVIFSLFGGKAYAIFALLFGFSFFIQDNNQRKRGYDFRLRFLWRLVLLFVWGVFNSIFYTGDILVFYSMVGLSLIAVARLPDKVVLWIAIIFLLQPSELIKIVIALIQHVNEPVEFLFMPYFVETMEILEKANFIEAVKTNLTSGQLFTFFWQIENGRLFQTSALFMLGMLIGRQKLLIDTPGNIRFWIRTIIIAALIFFPLNGLRQIVPNYIENPSIITPLNIIMGSLCNFTFMVFLVSLVILLFYRTRLQKVLMKLAIYGRMSLTMYITQSVMGGFFFYHWGLGLARELSVSQSLIVAVIIFPIQYTFAYFWFKYHKQGPLEWVWKKATWIGVKNKK